ncbi:MAG: hypothetical protein K5867_09470 [Bacteroidales bacterium]|nr:hypothetical protein [Bacteroidales bacterium]
MSLFNHSKNQIRCPECNSRKIVSVTKTEYYTVTHPSTARKIKGFLLQLGSGIVGGIIGGPVGDFVGHGGSNYDTNEYESKKYTYIKHTCQKCGHEWKTDYNYY